jgi:hypothetical protein
MTPRSARARARTAKKKNPEEARMKRLSTLGHGLLAVALAGLGCTGTIEPSGPSAPGDRTGPPDGAGGSTTDHGAGGTKGGSGGSGPAPAGPDVPGTAAVRRLTRLEYNNTIRDLLGDASRPGDRLPGGDQESGGSGFLKGGAVAEVDAQTLIETSGQLATTAVGKLGTLVSCGASPAPAQEDACAKDFIAKFGRRTFRRPLSTDEQAGLYALYQKQRGPEIGADFPGAIRIVLQAMLLSPSFLYRWELGAQAPLRDGQLVRFNPHELASRLSYLLWASMPDEALFGAADGDKLSSPTQIEDQVRRMLKDGKAKDTFADFHLQLLGMAGTLDAQKDENVYPTFNKAMAQSMLTETREFVASVLGPGGDGKLESLLTSRATFVDETLSKLYVTGQAVTGTAFKPVTLDPGQRAGLLLQANFLTVQANTYETHPIKRGVEVVEQLLCQPLPPPPPNVPTPKQAQDGVSTRQRYSEHEANACAKACHAIFDPFGFAFENWDGIGAYRTMDHGTKVDSTGTVQLTSGPFQFTSAIDLLPVLAKDQGVRDCLATQWLRYTLRRHEGAGDMASLATARQAFEKSGYDLRELIVAITKTKAFTHRTPSNGEVLQ